MRFIPFIAILLAACATPRQSYYFDHYSVTSGPDAASAAQHKPLAPPLMVESQYLSASTGSVVPMLAPSQEELQKQSRYGHKTQSRGQATSEQLRQGRKQIIQAVKQFRKELRATNRLSKSASKASSPLNDQATQKLDKEVTIAIVFGAVGITLSLLGGVSTAFEWCFR